MKEEIYLWMKSLAIFYILLTCVLHLVPDKKYERYVRFFMGLVLTGMLCSPIFSIFGESRNLLAEFEIEYEQENLLREQEELENIQEVYLRKAYREQLQEAVLLCLEKAGAFGGKAEVEFSGERLSVMLYFEKAPDAETKRRIQDELMENCGIREGEYKIRISAPGKTAVAGASAYGAASGDSDAAGEGFR